MTTWLNLLQVFALFALIWSVWQQVRWTKRLVAEYDELEALQVKLLNKIMGEEDPE